MSSAYRDPGEREEYDDDETESGESGVVASEFAWILPFLLRISEPGYAGY